MTIALARQIAKYEERGFNRERAEINAMMEIAATTIFTEFPDAFVLFGGAALVLHHDSLRHSADLDLLARASKQPSAAEIIECLQSALGPIAQILNLGELRFPLGSSSPQERRIFIVSESDQQLFRVDLSSFGSAIESQIEDHHIQGEAGGSVTVKSASKELLLLQKAEAFLLRRYVKARDAYDIHLLGNLGARLNPNLRAHLHDALLSNEIDTELISNRIEQIEPRLCNLELKPILPFEIYSALETLAFDPLRSALKNIYREWL